MVILYFADIFGRPGRAAIRKSLPDLLEKYKPDFVIANAENLAGGRGVNKKCFNEMMGLGFHLLTSGNHIWDNKEIFAIMASDTRILRPLNWLSPESDPCPGKGFTIIENNGKKLAVINLMGRVFMDAIDCPFSAVNEALLQIPEDCAILVDMHADATSEKYAMGWHLNGRVSAVVGSHSHVQTADERILTKGTAYITDVGMTGSFDSVIGLKPEEIIRRFMLKRPVPVQTATENLGVGCVIITVGDDKKATQIERLRFHVPSDDLTGDLE